MNDIQNIELDTNFLIKCNEDDFFIYLELRKQLEEKMEKFKEQKVILNQLISKYE